MASKVLPWVLGIGGVVVGGTVGAVVYIKAKASEASAAISQQRAAAAQAQAAAAAARASQQAPQQQGGGGASWLPAALNLGGSVISALGSLDVGF